MESWWRTPLRPHRHGLVVQKTTCGRMVNNRSKTSHVVARKSRIGEWGAVGEPRAMNVLTTLDTQRNSEYQTENNKKFILLSRDFCWF